MRLVRTSTLLACVVLLLTTGCRRQRADVIEMNFRHRPADASPKVASFGDDGISSGELKQRFLEMTPMGRSRFQTVEQKREYVDGLVRFELLAQEALRRGMGADPEVVHAAKQMLVQKLLKQAV